jgi:integral membrane protein
MKKISIQQLRLISLIEGISFLLLIFIGMPLKYGMGIQSVNMALGMGHGLLTMVFCLVLGLVWLQKTLSTQWCIGVFVASLLPFGAFVAEKKLKGIQSN